MSRSAFVLAAALFAVGGVVAGWFATRPSSVPKAPQRQRGTAAPRAENPTGIPTEVSSAPSPAPAPLPDPSPWTAAPAAEVASESIEALFDRARWLAEQDRDYKGAIGLYKRVVARQGESRLFAARALLEIGCCLEQMSRRREAIEAFRMVVERFADQREPYEAARRRLPQEEQDALARNEELGKQVAEGRVDLDLVDEPFGYVIELLREQTRLNVILDYRTLPEAWDRKLTVRLWNAPVSEALDRIASGIGARWIMKDACVVIVGQEEPKAEAAPPLPAWEADIPAWRQEEEEMRTALSATPVSLSLEDAGLVEMARAIQQGTSKLIVVDEAVEDAQDKRVTFQVRELDPSNTLDLICRMLELEWYVDRGTIHVTTEEAAEAWRKEHE